MLIGKIHNYKINENKEYIGNVTLPCHQIIKNIKLAKIFIK